MAITQGDAYLVPIIIKQGDTMLTDEMVNGVKVAVGSAVCSYPNGTLRYSRDDGVWYFPLTQKISNKLTPGKADFQVQVKMDGGIVGTKIKQVDVNECIIKGEWE